MRLVHKVLGTEIKVGDTVYDGNDSAKVLYFAKPHKSSSSGLITVEWPRGGTGQYYVGVFGLEWIEREDRTS